MSDLGNLVFNGAHHRTLLDTAIGDNRSCAWLTGDIAGLDRRGSGSTGLAEFGLCHDLVPHALRIGLGFGTSYARQAQINGGRNKIDGQYVSGEIGYAVPGSGIVLSALGLYGRWGVDTVRGYGAVGSSPSNGHTRVEYYAARARIDWRDAARVGKLRFSPSVAYTHASAGMDAYQETGGSAPASFTAQRQGTDEIRTTLTAAFALSPKTELRGNVDYVHRLDSNSGTVAVANVLGVVNVANNFAGGRLRQDWARFGADIEHHLSAHSIVSLSSNYSTAGQDADYGASISFKLLF